MTRSGGLTICAALAVALLARKFFLALDTIENALEDGLSEKSLGDWPNWSVRDFELFHAANHDGTEREDNDA